MFIKYLGVQYYSFFFFFFDRLNGLKATQLVSDTLTSGPFPCFPADSHTRPMALFSDQVIITYISYCIQNYMIMSALTFNKNFKYPNVKSDLSFWRAISWLNSYFAVFFSDIQNLFQILRRCFTKQFAKMEDAVSAGMIAQKIFFKFVSKLLHPDQLLTSSFGVLATYI